jgi:hypothetical protein
MTSRSFWNVGTLLNLLDIRYSSTRLIPEDVITQSSNFFHFTRSSMQFYTKYGRSQTKIWGGRSKNEITVYHRAGAQSPPLKKFHDFQENNSVLGFHSEQASQPIFSREAGRDPKFAKSV